MVDTYIFFVLCSSSYYIYVMFYLVNLFYLNGMSHGSQ